MPGPLPCRSARLGTAVLALLLLGSCSDAPTGPEPERIEFTASRLTLDARGEGAVAIRNRGTAPVGPIRLTTGPIRGSGGSAMPGAQLVASPATIPTLPAGVDREVSFTIEAPTPLPRGSYEVAIEARDGNDRRLASLEVDFTLECASDRPPAATLELSSAPSTLHRGEVGSVAIVARDASGAALDTPCLAWELDDATAGLLTSDGRFVGYETGSARISVRSGDAELQLQIQVLERQVASGGFTEIGQGEWTAQHTSDLWVRGDAAYTGTWGQRAGSEGLQFGNSLHAWDVSDPAAPVRTHTVEVDARTVNDVKVHEDGTLAVITHENSNDGQNGITLLDLSDPLEPTPIARYTEGLQAGIHNVWLDGDHLYLVVNGIGNGLRVLDISDPAEPTRVASFYGGSSFLHDVYVRDGLAFLSHWDAGLIILDVGHGIAGGSPSNPIEVGRTTTTGGRTHNAWYWPETGYVFVGEENFGNPGRLHVIDATELANPREVATFRVSGYTPHNVWLDEDRGILYAAWYGRGIRAIDVTGELLGELDRQGREIASAEYGAAASAPLCTDVPSVVCSWAPQLQDGLIFVSDLNSGLRVLRPDF